MKKKPTSKQAVISAIVTILMAILFGTSSCNTLFPSMSTVNSKDEPVENQNATEYGDKKTEKAKNIEKANKNDNIIPNVAGLGLTPSGNIFSGGSIGWNIFR